MAKTTVALSVGLLYYLYALDYLVTYTGYTTELTSFTKSLLSLWSENCWQAKYNFTRVCLNN